MKNHPIFLLPFLFILASAHAGTEKQTHLPDNSEGEYAPPDAYLNGSKHPYYGSENAWEIATAGALESRFFARDAATEYMRRGQKALLEIIAGRPAEAEAYCRQLLERDTEDLEARFNLAVALTRQHRLAEAMAEVKAAVDFGLPLGRFLAGPRELLKPLVESPEFQAYAAPFNLEVIQGPMLGRVTDGGASFWVRTAHAVSLRVAVSEHDDLTDPVVSPAVRSDPALDYTAIATVAGLRPGTLYYYRVLVDGAPTEKAAPLSFRTYPLAGRPASFQVAFGGGAGYTPWHERIWDVIRLHQPAAFLWLGDNVYIDTPLEPDDIRYCYYQRQARPEFRRMVSATSNYAMWDDHDVSTDDCWMGPYQDKPAWKMPMLDYFKEQWINPHYGSEEWPACWFSFNIADVEFFMLDGRFYRTNPFDANPTMLGPVQKAWLLHGLEQSKATFKVIVSGVPWAYDSKPGVRDTWNGFHAERTEIFDFLAEHHISGVVLLSGDRHRTDIRKITRPNGYTLYDWENCRLTNEIVHAVEPGALFGYNDKQTFGLLSFDTKAADPSVTFSAYSIDDEKVFAMTLHLSELADPKRP